MPNQVLTDEDYATARNTSLPREQRIAAYNTRENWLRALTGPAPEQMLQMIADFGKMGIVEARPGIENDPDFPAVMLVESLAGDRAQQLTARAAERLTEGGRLERPRRQSRLEQAGWESAEQLAD